MLPILQNKSILTMTSREIATLTSKRHDNVTRVCRELIDQGLTSQIEELTFEHNGNKYTEFKLCKRDSILLVARLSPEFTAAIVDRWQELEDQQPKHILPQSFSEALQLAANQAAELEAARPAVEFVEKYVESTGNMGFRQVAKLLKIKENNFREFLLTQRIMYRLGSEWMPYACHIDAGRFNVSTGTSDTNHSFNAAKFTPKGVEWVSKLLSAYKF